MHLKMFAHALAATKYSGKTKKVINAGSHTEHKTDSYPMSDTICSTMCLLKATITNSFCGKRRGISHSVHTQQSYTMQTKS